MRGSLLVPAEPGYDEARSIWNAMIDRRPALIVRCLGVADVMACVDVARRRGVPICIKGGGHNIAGLAVQDGGLLLDMSLMRGVWVDAQQRLARAQAGCLLGDVDRETQVHGLAAVLGFISNTGCAGLTLGGGFGYLTRRFGWTSDNVTAVDLVTADGRLVRASEREHSDLFWAVRGGGGNFGVATGFDYALHPVGPDIVGGAIAWRGEDAEAVLDMYRTLATEAPRELTCVAALRLAPPAPWLAKEVHGKPIVALFVCYSGPIDEGRATDRAAQGVRPSRRATCSSGGRTTRSRRCSTQRSPRGGATTGNRNTCAGWSLACSPAQSRMPGGSRRRTRRSSSFRSRAPSTSGRTTTPPSAIATPRRSSTSPPPGNERTHDAAQIAWAREAWGDLRQFSTGGTYINFLTEDEGDDRTRAAFRSNYARLAEAKRAWDPENLFRANKNIRA